MALPRDGFKHKRLYGNALNPGYIVQHTGTVKLHGLDPARTPTQTPQLEWEGKPKTAFFKNVRRTANKWQSALMESPKPRASPSAAYTEVFARLKITEKQEIQAGMGTLQIVHKELEREWQAIPSDRQPRYGHSTYMVIITQAEAWLKKQEIWLKNLESAADKVAKKSTAQTTKEVAPKPSAPTIKLAAGVTTEGNRVTSEGDCRTMEAIAAVHLVADVLQHLLECEVDRKYHISADSLFACLKVICESYKPLSQGQIEAVCESAWQFAAIFNYAPVGHTFPGGQTVLPQLGYRDLHEHYNPKDQPAFKGIPPKVLGKPKNPAA